MSLIAPMPLTEVDLLRAAETPGVEFVDGELREKPMSIEAARVANRVSFFLTGEAIRTNGGPVYSEAAAYRCYAEDSTMFRKPDVSFIRAERAPVAGADSSFLPMPADLAVEVISPNDVGYDIEAKVAEYLAAGFGTVWVVWPNVRTVRVHRAGESSRECRGDDEITGEPFMPAFRCPVRAFFE